jgi:steroid delta-isomerase-like uncharacterized protein
MSAALSPEDNKALARRALDEVWTRGNLDAIAQIYTPGYIIHDPNEPADAIGHEGLRQQVTLYRTAFPDLHFDIISQIAEGNTVVTQWRSTGTHNGDLRGIAPTGKSITTTGISISRIENGKAAEEWVNWDALGLLRQLGVIPQ